MSLLAEPRQRNLETDPRSSLLGDILFPLPAHRRTTIGILTWWESRRLIYNVIVGGTGLVSLAFIGVLSLFPFTRGLWPSWEPIVAFGVLANVCFTFGSVVEIGLQRLWKDKVLPVGPALFRQGLAFSVGLALLPVVVTGLAWVVQAGMLIFGR